MRQWDICDIALSANADHDWWTYPVVSTFVHVETGTRIVLEGFWNGGQSWVIRFAPTMSGAWSWRTSSPDPGLDGRVGELTAAAPSPAQIERNPNYRGHLRISRDGRYFEYADGAPFFLLADTLWAGNTARCGLGENRDGPFYRYLSDRKAKGFTTILMQYMRGFGDTTTEPAGQRNEGGHPFREGDVARLNPAYFRYLDVRMSAIREHGFVAANPTTWFGKMRNCFFSLTWAKRISAYLTVRYNAYNLLRSLSGEYQYAMRDCGWTTAQIDEIGREVQAHNAYRHPLSIHPSGAMHWEAPHGGQSSNAFHNSDWLDHTWLQTGQRIDRMCHIAIRCREHHDLQPIRPIFCSEAYYERPPETDSEGAYHARWQAWCAFLNGALGGYGYGAFGMWQFYDPDDPEGEIGKSVKGVVPWPEALALEGATQLQHVKVVLTACDWWRLAPRREWLTVDGSANPMPTPSDLTPPHCAAIPGECYIVYIPRGNSHREIIITNLQENGYTARWLDPHDGREMAAQDAPEGVSAWAIPHRPEPSNEDWVYVLDAV